jgi:hypothetical protein
MMFFKQPDLYPETPYTKYVAKIQEPDAQVYCFAVVLFWFGCLRAEHTPKLAIVFPLMVLICIPSRLFLLPKLFEGWEILLIDGDDDTIALWLEPRKHKKMDVCLCERARSHFIQDMVTLLLKNSLESLGIRKMRVMCELKKFRATTYCFIYIVMIKTFRRDLFFELFSMIDLGNVGFA